MTYRVAGGLLLLFAAALMAFSGCEDPGSYGDAPVVIEGNVVVYESTVAPSMTDPRDNLWDDITRYSVTVGDPDSAYTHDAQKFRVLIQAVKSGTRLYLRLEWPDAGMDSIPRHLEHFLSIKIDTLEIDPELETDTTKLSFWVRYGNFVPDSLPIYDPDDSTIVDYYLVSNKGYDQDRLAIMWDVGDNGSEAADCATMCHMSGDTSILGDQMYTTGGGHVDVWQWQAATADPLFLAQDEYWSGLGRVLDEHTHLLADVNFDTVLVRPLFVHRDTTAYQGAYLYSTEARAYTNAEDSIAWPSSFEVPGYVLNEGVGGSIADVASYSSYYSRTALRWVILMSRQLNTGHPDDLNLSTIAKGDSVMASIAVMNNSDRLHSGSAPFYFIFR